jgi:hypothetical protein
MLDNTEVKLPINDRNGLTPIPVLSPITASAADSGSDQTPDGGTYLNEYNLLNQWYTEVPRDMFVQRGLRHYASSEADLENIRQLLFDALREFEDFPYDVN